MITESKPGAETRVDCRESHSHTRCAVARTGINITYTSTELTVRPGQPKSSIIICSKLFVFGKNIFVYCILSLSFPASIAGRQGKSSSVHYCTTVTVYFRKVSFNISAVLCQDGPGSRLLCWEGYDSTCTVLYLSALSAMTTLLINVLV